jgi:hypothetical protein
VVPEETSGTTHLAVSTRSIGCESPGPDDAVTCQGCRHGGLPFQRISFVSGGALSSGRQSPFVASFGQLFSQRLHNTGLKPSPWPIDKRLPLSDADLAALDSRFGA